MKTIASTPMRSDGSVYGRAEESSGPLGPPYAASSQSTNVSMGANAACATVVQQVAASIAATAVFAA